MINFKQDEAALPQVGVIMGSQSDWETMCHSCETLKKLNIPYETHIVSAHRTPDRLRDYALNASTKGIKIIIAGAGGAAHLPGMCAAWTDIPVLGVPIESRVLKGKDSLLSIVQMPAGVPVATFAIGKAGSINAAIFAASILGLDNDIIKQTLIDLRQKQTDNVAHTPVNK